MPVLSVLGFNCRWPKFESCIKQEGTRAVALSVLDLNRFKSPCLTRPEIISFIAC